MTSSFTTTNHINTTTDGVITTCRQLARCRGHHLQRSCRDYLHLQVQVVIVSTLGLILFLILIIVLILGSTLLSGLIIILMLGSTLTLTLLILLISGLILLLISGLLLLILTLLLLLMLGSTLILKVVLQGLLLINLLTIIRRIQITQWPLRPASGCVAPPAAQLQGALLRSALVHLHQGAVHSTQCWVHAARSAVHLCAGLHLSVRSTVVQCITLLCSAQCTQHYSQCYHYHQCYQCLQHYYHHYCYQQ